jgi:hypothetical protein
MVRKAPLRHRHLHRGTPRGVQSQTPPPLKEEAALPEWQAAIEALMLVADLGGPTMFARIGMMRALNRHRVREFNPARKDHHWGRRKLKRAQ